MSDLQLLITFSSLLQFSESDRRGLNRNNYIHATDILSTNQGTIIGFEDGDLNVETHKDYNDIVLAIEGVQTIGLNPVEDVMAHNRNWLEEEVGIEILDYFA